MERKPEYEKKSLYLFLKNKNFIKFSEEKDLVNKPFIIS